MKRFICTAFALMSAVTLILAADAPKDFKVSELTFKTPQGWEWVETTSSMRKAQLKIPGTTAKDSGEVVFFHFGAGNGGGTQANVDRWFGQFQEGRDKINARTEETTVGKTKVTYVRAEGTYKSGMPGGPQTPMADFALSGAIIEAGQGHIFVRLTGPKSLVEKNFADFKKLVESALP